MMKSKLALLAAIMLAMSCGEREDKKPTEQNQYTIINGTCYRNGKKSECPEDKTPEQPKVPEMDCDCSCECKKKEAIPPQIFIPQE